MLSKKFILPPLERCHAVDIDENDNDRSDILKNRTHPRTDLETSAGVCLTDEIIPTPAELVAAEQRQHKRAERQDVVRNDKVPQIKPGGAFRERLKMNDAVSESG